MACGPHATGTKNRIKVEVQILFKKRRVFLKRIAQLQKLNYLSAKK